MVFVCNALVFNFPNGRVIVMLCFSHVWPDMQRYGERESKMDFKEEASKVFGGARACPVLLAEENLGFDCPHHHHPPSYGLNSKTGFQESEANVENSGKSGSLQKKWFFHSVPTFLCKTYPQTHPQMALSCFVALLGLNPWRFIVMVQVENSLQNIFLLWSHHISFVYHM